MARRNRINPTTAIATGAVLVILLKSKPKVGDIEDDAINATEDLTSPMARGASEAARKAKAAADKAAAAKGVTPPDAATSPDSSSALPWVIGLGLLAMAVSKKKRRRS